MGGHGGPPLHRACVNEHVVKPQHLVPENNYVSTGGHGGPPLRRGFAFNHEIRIRGRGVGGAACLVKAGGINDRGNKPNGHKTKHPIPAIAGTKHPAGAGDHPGRLGDGRNRTRRDVQHPKPKGNPSGTGGHSGPPLHRGDLPPVFRTTQLSGCCYWVWSKACLFKVDRAFVSQIGMPSVAIVPSLNPLKDVLYC